MLLIQSSNAGGKGTAAAQKAFQLAVQEHTFPDSLLRNAVHGHNLTLRVLYPLLCGLHCSYI
jgi:hypothetical protein